MNKRLKVKAVAFDRDGVIINTEGVIIDSARKAFKQLGFDLLEEDVPQIVGHSYDVYKDYFLKKWDFNADEFRKISRDLFYLNLDQAKFFDGTINLIKSLHTKDIPIALTTSAPIEGTMFILSKAGIENLFNVFVTKEDVKNLKPDPEPYILTAKKLDIEPEFCVAIEDTALGVEAAKKAGMKCIAIPTEFSKDQDFSIADLVLEDAKEVEDTLEFV